LALRKRNQPRQRAIIITLGLFGAALFYGDGIITPAISVLSAVEGLEVAAPGLHRYVIPLTLAILIGLFMFQSKGTEKVGKLFGPIMLFWFISLALMGVDSIIQSPDIVQALYPKFGLQFFLTHHWHGFLALGAVVLVVTGTEALYADMGHFGRKPIQASWIVFVMPALLLNYLGQGALILRNPEAIQNPFYLLAPDWALYPLIALSTASTVIASQAVISGAFSITRQAVQLDYIPRQHFIHTSNSQIGQIYAPDVNRFLLVAVVVLVMTFQNSTNLANAYGFAVTGTMTVTTCLAFIVALDVWKWEWRLAALFLGVFLTIDLSFFFATAMKIIDGGWFPLLIGSLLFLLMSTWKKGRQELTRHLQRSSISLTQFLSRVEAEAPLRVAGTAIFLYSRHLSLPFALLQNLEYNKILHERVILVTVAIHDIPYVYAKDRLEVEDLGQNFYRITIHFGFKQAPDIPYALELSKQQGLPVNLRQAQFFLGRETLVPSDKPALNPWQERIFILMFRNASNPISFFGIPTDQALEIGTMVEV
ncbi:MAG: KUP/HAK/KT family potassium transporter, partial [Methylococcaceae bacterium]|nr:KUP/HAK/KT family potassium transporter [Methylococcaceae bacterium]